MFTKLALTLLARIGERQRAAYLVPQAMYTLGLAATEKEALVPLLPPNCLEDVTSLCDEVDHARQDKSIAASEAKQATGNQQELTRALKVWRRQVASHVEMSQLAGANVPGDVVQVSRSHAVPVLLDEASRTLALLEQHKSEMDAISSATQPLVDEGRKLYQDLLKAEGTQEQARTKDLPDAIATFSAKKGKLYIGLKMINAAGHRLHAHEPTRSAQYNLSLVNRRHAQASAQPTPAPPAPPPAPAPAPAAAASA
jgi:hypothetical protein